MYLLKTVSYTHLDVYKRQVVLLIPINNITDMVRTLTNVTDASVCAAVVARQNGLLNDEVFAKEDEKLEKGEA